LANGSFIMMFVPRNHRDWTDLNQLPEYANSLIVRTDFEREAEWQAVLRSIEDPRLKVDSEYRAALEVMQDVKLRDFAVDPLMGSAAGAVLAEFLVCGGSKDARRH
jgi:hypothetical protein